MQRVIFHIDVDAYFAQVEQMLNPALRGKPVIVGHVSTRGVVAAASYEARAFGVHSAMPIYQAKRLCPQAVFVNGHFRHYETLSHQMHELFYKYTPLVEMASLDEAYLDMSHQEMRDDRRKMREVAQEIKDDVKKQTGLTVSIGIGPNKLIAKIASGEAKPNGIKEVSPDAVTAFLEPMPVEKLPGVGSKTKVTLNKFGIKTVKQLGQLPERSLRLMFGISGTYLANLAKGIDESPVMPAGQSKSIGRETTFATDTRDKAFLAGMLHYLLERVARQLREEELKAQTVSVKIRYADFDDAAHSRKLDSPTNQDAVLYKIAQELLDKILKEKSKKVRLIGVSLSNLVSANYHQTDLFGEVEQVKLKRLYETVDRIRAKYGFSALTIGQSIKLIKALERDKHGFALHTPSLSR